MKKAYFAGGCFWCITPVFHQLKGVTDVIAGYCGGSEAAPTYEEVKHQKTGHRETICITYDETQVSYQTLLNIFLANVDPHDGEGQFIDRGFSYTLACYVNDEEEKILAEKRIAELKQKTGKQVCVAVEAFDTFWNAEEYHQYYYLKNPEAFEKELRDSGRK